MAAWLHREFLLNKSFVCLYNLTLPKGRKYHLHGTGLLCDTATLDILVRFFSRLSVFLHCRSSWCVGMAGGWHIISRWFTVQI